MELAAAVDRQIERLIRAACASVLSLTVVVVVPRQVDGQMIDGGNPIEALDTDLTDCAIPHLMSCGSAHSRALGNR